MTLAQVLAATGLILLTMVTWACMLATVALLFPRQSEKAEATLAGSPAACFFGGLGMAIILMIGLALINAKMPIFTLIGALLCFALAIIMTIGSAGVVRLLSKRIGQMDGGQPSFKALLRGSFIYSVGLNVPILGWFLFAPLSLLFTLGAGISGMFPAPQPLAPPVIVPPAPHDYDVMERQGVK
jgi:hypothetical protein